MENNNQPNERVDLVLPQSAWIYGCPLIYEDVEYLHEYHKVSDEPDTSNPEQQIGISA